MGRAVFAGFDAGMGASHDDGFVRFFCNSLAGLVADRVQPAGNVTQGSNEGPIGGCYPDMMAEGRQA